MSKTGEAAARSGDGAIDPDMFGDANGEHLFVYAKLEAFLPGLREAMGSQQMLASLEEVVKATPDYEQKIAMIKDRIAKLGELMKQRNAAQAATAGD